jgi:tetratricopeptide (TPR) repeat protein
MLLCVLLLWFQTPPALAQEHARRGLEFSQKGDLKSAESEFREAIKLAPHDAFSLASLGAILRKQQKLDEADVYFERALKIDPNDADTRYNLAVNQFGLGQFVPAKINLERILKAKPDTKRAVLLLGTVVERLKDYRRAASLLESVPDLVRQQPEWIATLARCYYHTELAEKGRETLDWLGPAGPEAIFLGGETAAQAGDFGTAERLFASIRATYPDRAQLTYEIAMVQYKARHFAESQTTLQQSIAAGTRDAKLFNLLSWCYHRQNRPPEAVAAMKTAIDLQPRIETHHDHLAQILLEQGRYTDAYESVKNALEVAPDSSQAYKLKAQVETHLGVFKQALESYARAVRLNPEDADSLLGLGSVQQKLFQLTEAAVTFEKGIGRFPRDPRFYQAYGRVLLDPGARRDAAGESRAVSLIEKALALNNVLPEAHYELGKFLLGNEKVADALPHLQAAAKLDPRDSKAHLALAKAYRRLGRNEESASELSLFKTLTAQGERAPD